MAAKRVPRGSKRNLMFMTTAHPPVVYVFRGISAFDPAPAQALRLPKVGVTPGSWEPWQLTYRGAETQSKRSAQIQAHPTGTVGQPTRRGESGAFLQLFVKWSMYGLDLVGVDLVSQELEGGPPVEHGHTSFLPPLGEVGVTRMTRTLSLVSGENGPQGCDSGRWNNFRCRLPDVHISASAPGECGQETAWDN